MEPSENTEKLVQELRKRSLFGQDKYKTSMDRRDLTLTQWAQHFKEECLDGAEYAERVKGGAELLESASALLERAFAFAPLKGQLHTDTREWLANYDKQFNAPDEIKVPTDTRGTVAAAADRGCAVAAGNPETPPADAGACTDAGEPGQEAAPSADGAAPPVDRYSQRDKELDLRLAHALGWNIISLFLGKPLKGDGTFGETTLIPLFSQSHGLVLEVVRDLDDVQMLDYMRYLEDDVLRVGHKGVYARMAACLTARPRQHAEALVLAIGNPSFNPPTRNGTPKE